MSEIPCLYCGSFDTVDCGEFVSGSHHIECNACHCAFALPIPEDQL